MYNGVPGMSLAVMHCARIEIKWTSLISILLLWRSVKHVNVMQPGSIFDRLSLFDRRRPSATFNAQRRDCIGLIISETFKCQEPNSVEATCTRNGSWADHTSDKKVCSCEHNSAKTLDGRSYRGRLIFFTCCECEGILRASELKVFTVRLFIQRPLT